MTFNKVIIGALCTLADEVASTHSMRDGFAHLKKPIGIETKLKPAWEKLGEDAWDAWDGFNGLGLDYKELMYMGWEGAPGASSDLVIYALTLPSNRRIYTRESDLDDEPVLLSVTHKKSAPRVDQSFLQYTFRNNEKSFGVQIASPPSEVSSCFRSFPFLIDLFVAAFDVAESWNELAENLEFWNEKYEKPEDPRKMVRENGSEVMKEKISDFIFDQQFRKRRPQDLDAKLQIVARWLADALGNAEKHRNINPASSR
jgi:hypothetical protein